MFDLNSLSAIQVSIASPEKIREWSRGEVTKPETINYRSQKPEPDGLFCEKIFGPAKDYQCHCGKYSKNRYQGIVCDKCGVEVTTKSARRERMGHIELSSPCAHIWYLRGIPSRIGLVLDISPKQLEEVVYFVSRVVLTPGTSKFLSYREVLDDRTSKEKFIEVINEIKENEHFEEGSSELEKADFFVEKLENPKEPLDFITTSAFISKYTGAKFGIGAEAIKSLLEEVNLEKEKADIQEKLVKAESQKRVKLLKRLDTIEAFITSNNRPEWMILTVIPVIPPDLRPMLQLDGGRYATSDLNDLYRKVITRNNRLKKLISMNAPSIILFNEKRMLQEAVDALIDNGRRNKPVNASSGRPLKSLSSTLKGKQGRFRQNLLGKRVDYSGRSVIAVGPSLKMYQCGIPVEMAIQLFKPFIAHELIAGGICQSTKSAEAKIAAYDRSVFDAIEKIIGLHPVLLNRAPTLHRLGIQAFKPILVEGRAIRLHPLVCTAFNADFDGDQMAVHVPLSEKAQKEAINLMLASHNILGPKDGQPICIPSQDMVLGNYYLTFESSIEDFKKRAELCRSQNDFEEALRYDLYAMSEGKVFRDYDEVMKAYQTKQIHLHNRIAILGRFANKDGFSEEMNNSYLITTVGKLIFNSIFPKDFPYLNEPTSENLLADQEKFFVPLGTDIKDYIAKLPLKAPFIKKDLGKIANEIFKKYHADMTSEILDNIKNQGFKYSTVSGLTVSIADISIMDGRDELIAKGDETAEKVNHLYKKGLLTDKERHDKVCKGWENVLADIASLLKKEMKENSRNPLFMMSASGARGSLLNFTQLLGMRGLMANPQGETIELPIKSCFREGLSVSEFFNAAHGARKGGADTALKTADSGYLTRRLVDVSHDVIIREEDCGSDHGFVVSDIYGEEGQVAVPLRDRLIGRFTVNDVINPKTGEVIIESNKMMDEDIASTIVNAGIKEVEIRSLFTCLTKDGVCVHCYGRNLATGELVKVGEAVGIMAAQSIGEPGTQLTMRTFHTGGVAGSDITQGLPRVQELLEARNPKGEAIISEISGKVTLIKEENGRHHITVTNDVEEKSYLTNFGAKLKVKVGDSIVNGQRLTAGAINPKQLLEVSDVTEVEKYLLKEVELVYRAQGIEISDKHVECVAKQMLRKMTIIDAGDTNLYVGMRVDITEFTAVNQKALIEGKKPAYAKPVILGITKAALDTNSFLSSASFQETTKVLTEAAIKGRVDHLHGLKENVMIGKLIPAGTGFLELDDEEEENEEENNKLVEVSLKREISEEQFDSIDNDDNGNLLN